MNETLAPARISANLKAIETKGFVVIRNFLDQEEIDIITNDFNESKRRAKNANYPISYAGSEIVDLLREKVTALSESVAEVTSTHVDADQGSLYFSISRGINFGWHQDHESYFLNQDHINYLNFYMIIVKEKREEANLNVIPFDSLKSRSPEYYQKIVGGGAARYEISEGRTHIISDETGKKIGILPYDIGALVETPQLNAGDLLLLRGDLIHSTQVSDSARVALSLRMVSSNTRVSLKKMVSGGKAKRAMMTKNRQTYSRIFNAFKTLKVSESTYAELIDVINQDNSPTPKKWSFVLRHWKLRLRYMFSGNQK